MATDFDAVIVGSGPGGGMVAWGLASKGWKVALLEKGRNPYPTLGDPVLRGSIFSNDEIKWRRGFCFQDPFMKPHHKDLEAFLTAVLGPRDRAFLLCFGNFLRVPQEFTASPQALLAGLQAYEKRDHRGVFPELGPVEIRTAGTAFYDAIYYSATEMLSGSEPGRKALILFSDGEDNSSAHHEMEALEAAQDRDVVLYAIRYTDAKDGHLTSRNKYGASVMARLANDTGGADFDARKVVMAKHFQEIGEQLRSSYELAYHSTNPAADGAFHKIVVQVKRPNLSVRAKAGYYAR